jgi:hypothetical protein
MEKQTTYRQIQGINDIGKEVYFYDYVKKEYYLKGILKGFDGNIFEILLNDDTIKNFQYGFIKEEL